MDVFISVQRGDRHWTTVRRIRSVTMMKFLRGLLGSRRDSIPRKKTITAIERQDDELLFVSGEVISTQPMVWCQRGSRWWNFYNDWSGTRRKPNGRSAEKGEWRVFGTLIRILSNTITLTESHNEGFCLYPEGYRHWNHGTMYKGFIGDVTMIKFLRLKRNPTEAKVVHKGLGTMIYHRLRPLSVRMRTCCSLWE